jgi:processing peptidase subunit alpha
MSLPQLVRGLATSSAAASAVPALATKSSGGLASMLGFGASRIDVPMSEPLPGVPKPLRGSQPASSVVKTSVLEGGAQLAALDTASPMTSIGVVLPGGSAYETEATVGASKVLENMAFMASSNRTTFRVTRELEKIGAVGFARAGRDSLTFGVDTLKIHAAEATEILLDTVLNARLNYHEFKEVLETAQAQLAEARANPAALVSEALHRAAYDGPLGKPLLADPAQVGGLSYAAFKEYCAGVLQPSRALIAGVGISHADLEGLAAPLVGAAHAAGAASPSAPAGYAGGAVTVLDSSLALSHVAVAIEAKGGASDVKSAAAAAVVKALLDESRSALPWARRESDLASVSAFAHMYRDSGLVGLVAAAAPGNAGGLVDAVSKRLEAVAKGVTDAQLRQAKSVAVGGYKAALASSSGALATLGPQLAFGGVAATGFAAAVEALTAADVAGFVAKGLKASPTVVVLSSTGYALPRAEALLRRLS